MVSWPKPTTAEDVRRFLGFVVYYRRFIQNFSKISKPLTNLIPTPSKKKTKSRQSTKREWKWENEEQTAFEELKKRLVKAPILAFADSTLPYEVHTDASVLYQQHDG